MTQHSRVARTGDRAAGSSIAASNRRPPHPERGWRHVQATGGEPAYFACGASVRYGTRSLSVAAKMPSRASSAPAASSVMP